MPALQAVGDELIDSIISENIPTLTEAEKFNEALTSCVTRIEAKLTGSHTQPPLPQPPGSLPLFCWLAGCQWNRRSQSSAAAHPLCLPFGARLKDMTSSTEFCHVFGDT